MKVQERKGAILRAAAQEFRTRGFHSTGMRDIAAALGMTVGNLYYYFENKESLLAFCQEEALRRLLELGNWVCQQKQCRVDARLFLMIVGHVLCLNEGAPGSLVHFEIDGLSERWRDNFVRHRDRYEGQVRDLLMEGMATGLFRQADSKMAGLAILGAVNWTVKWFRADGKQDARTLGKAFADQLVRGLLAEGVELQVPDAEVPSFDGEGIALAPEGDAPE